MLYIKVVDFKQASVNKNFITANEKEEWGCDRDSYMNEPKYVVYEEPQNNSGFFKTQNSGPLLSTEARVDKLIQRTGDPDNTTWTRLKLLIWLC